jgi:hypothetical protein
MADSMPGYSPADDLAYIRYAWRGAYVVDATGHKWVASAKFGTRDVLEADTADDLLGKIRRHYPGLIHRSVASSQQ